MLGGGAPSRGFETQKEKHGTRRQPEAACSAWGYNYKGQLIRTPCLRLTPNHSLERILGQLKPLFSGSKETGDA